MSDFVKQFIEKMLELGAGHDQSASEIERNKWFEEAEEEYKLHIYTLFKANGAKTSDSGLNLCGVNGSACETHKIKQLSYLQWHEWAESLNNKGIKQVQCNKCKRWLFPEEI